MYPSTTINDICNDLMDIKDTFTIRAVFVIVQSSKLNARHALGKIKDSDYMKRMCFLFNEKRNINNAYRKMVTNYIASIPPMMIFEDVIEEFQGDII